MSYERANTDDTVDDYDKVTAEFLDYVLARFPVMYPDEAEQLILNNSCFYSLATLLNDLFASRSHRRYNKGHKRTLINVAAELESSNISIDQNSILSSVRLHTLIAVYFLQTSSAVDARRHLKEAAEIVSNNKDWLFNNTGFKVVYFGILRVCFEYGVEPPEDLATGYSLQDLSQPGNIAWLYTSAISTDYFYHIRRSIWIHTVAQGNLIFKEQIRRLKNGNLNVDEISTQMHNWLQFYDYAECPNPALWELYGIDQLSAIDAELKFLRPIYDTAIRLVEGDLATSTGSIDDETSMTEFYYRANKTFNKLEMIRNFINKSIRYVKSKQDLFDVDRRCGFQKECDYLNCILQSFLVLESERFHKIIGLTSYELSSMISRTRKYGNKSTPPNFLCTLASEKWKKICKERRESRCLAERE